MRPVESSNPFVSPADPAWDEAFLRVESYLRAYGLESAVLLNRVTSEIIAVARASAPEHAEQEPVTVALAVTQARIGEWISRAGRAVDWSDDQVRARGRLALIVTEMPARWADFFLSDQPAPVDLAAAMAEFHLLPGPELRLSGMAPEPLEFGFESGDERLPARRFWLPVRAMVSWLLIFGVFGITWAASH
jgi:hypothetical protein